MKPNSAQIEHIGRDVQIQGLRTVRIEQLYVGLLPIVGGFARYVPVNETPHFAFVQHVLAGDHVRSVHGYRDYAHYISINPHPCTERQFEQLIESILQDGNESQHWPILVARSWHRPWPLNRWQDE